MLQRCDAGELNSVWVEALAGTPIISKRGRLMYAKWLLGLSVALAGAGYAASQDPTERRQPPPASEGSSRVQVEGRSTTGVQVEGRRVEGRVDAQGRPIQVEGQVNVERSARPRNFHRAKDLLGSKVSIDGGLAVGTVDDVVFADDGVVEFIVVANEGKLVSVPWAASKFDFQARTAVVGITQDKFRQIPTFTAESYPTFDTQYVQRTYSYYNVPQPTGATPRQERKMERRVERGKRP